MSTNPISSFVLCVWKFANLPPSTQQETDRKSVQLFIVFLPVPPQETVPAANGAQQRLHSLVRIRDTHVVRPLTHLRTAIANTAVLPLKWSSAYPLRPLDTMAWGLWMGPVRHLLMLSDMHELLNCSKKVQVYAGVYSWRVLCSRAPLCACEFTNVYMEMCAFYIHR